MQNEKFALFWLIAIEETMGNPVTPIEQNQDLNSVSLPARLEAILYLKGRALKIQELVEISQEPKSLVEEFLLN